MKWLTLIALAAMTPAVASAGVPSRPAGVMAPIAVEAINYSYYYGTGPVYRVPGPPYAMPRPQVRDHRYYAYPPPAYLPPPRPLRRRADCGWYHVSRWEPALWACRDRWGQLFVP